MCYVTTGRPRRSAGGSRWPSCRLGVGGGTAAARKGTSNGRPLRGPWRRRLAWTGRRRWRVDTGERARPGLAQSRAVGRRCVWTATPGPAGGEGRPSRRQSAAIAGGGFSGVGGAGRERGLWRSRQVGRAGRDRRRPCWAVARLGCPSRAGIWRWRRRPSALCALPTAHRAPPRRNDFPTVAAGSPAPPGPVTGYVTAEGSELVSVA